LRKSGVKPIRGWVRAENGYDEIVDGVLGRLDSAVGRQVERLVISHHRRRLARIGQDGVLAAPPDGWASGGSPPRRGNRLDVHIDGASAISELADAIEGARSFVWLGGFFFSADFRLRQDSPETLRQLLARTAERIEVRVLAWAGAPLPLFHPDRSEVREARDALVEGTAVRMALDERERPLHCHHEKIVIVDGQVAYVGGIDLTTYAGDRLDSAEHPVRGSLGWHDASVGIRGPAVADVAEHFRLRWAEVTGEELRQVTAPDAAGDVELQVVRTVPERVYRRLPHGEFSILESYLRALRSARKLVYLENQFLWSPEVVSVLEDKLRNPPADDFRLVVVLPVRPNNGNDDTRGQLGVLVEADNASNGEDRFLACTLFQRGQGAGPVYVHAKLGIVDDRWLTVGSANLNEHSLFNDTEMNVVTHDETLARATRLELWSEHLGRPAAELEGDPSEIVDRLWRPLAQSQLDRQRRGLPLTENLVLLPHVSRRANAILGPINGLVVDG
jgi:phosphatidylserine/phosphatidylglycerophosphate/cardiolipin synthase-like enzyme